MKLSTSIHVFLLSVIAIFGVFFIEALFKAGNEQAEAEFDHFKIIKLQELTNAFQFSLIGHQLKELKVLNNNIPEVQLQQIDAQINESINILQETDDETFVNQLGIQQRYYLEDIILLMRKLQNNDNKRLSLSDIEPNNLYALNSDYYIKEISKIYYSYTYDTRLTNSDTYTFIESIRANQRLIITMTEAVDGLLNYRTERDDEKKNQIYMGFVYTVGVMNALYESYDFINNTFFSSTNDKNAHDFLTEITNELSKVMRFKTHISLRDYIEAPDKVAEYSSYIINLNNLLNTYSQSIFSIEINELNKRITLSQNAFYGIITLGALVLLFVIIPIFVFSLKISHWLKITNTNISRIQNGNFDLMENNAFSTMELQAISETLIKLKDYQLKKTMLERDNQQLIVELRKLSFFDPLTNIYNRRSFFNESNNISESDYPATFCIVDIDNFKSVNDTYGHDIGDKVLVEFSKLLSSSLRITDIYCRYGGEEFAIILKKCAIRDAAKIMHNLLTATAHIPIESDEKKIFHFTISCGIAPINDIKLLYQSIKHADEALYHSKNNGKNVVTMHNGETFIRYKDNEQHIALAK